MKTCPICGSQADQAAFFCEFCGYDYLTGAKPRNYRGENPAESGSLQQPPTAPAQPAPPNQSGAEPVRLHVVEEAVDHSRENALIVPSAAPAASPTPAPAPMLTPTPNAAPAASPEASGARPRSAWVAEIWIDPEWYRIQQAPDQLPSPGQPVIIGLRQRSIVIGRISPSSHPDIDCGNDSGVSRRHACLSSDGQRWFIEDLGSSNGTYLGQVDQALPTEAITARVELGPHHRIYVGSWTRIVVRPALVEEGGL